MTRSAHLTPSVTPTQHHTPHGVGRAATLAASLALALGLAACDNGSTVSQQVDASINKTEQAVDQAKAQAGQQLDQAKASAERAADKVGQAVDNAADKTADAVSDIAITTAVNAELTKDPSLSALRINVDTQAGRVVLNGSAPDTLARERATTLAAGVKGVTSVDNRLEVRG